MQRYCSKAGIQNSSYTINGYRVSYKKPGLELLQQIYKSMEWAFHYNAGNGEKMDPYDSALMMQHMFKNR